MAHGDRSDTRVRRGRDPEAIKAREENRLTDQLCETDRLLTVLGEQVSNLSTSLAGLLIESNETGDCHTPKCPDQISDVARRVFYHNERLTIINQQLEFLVHRINESV